MTYRDDGSSIYSFADRFIVRCPRCDSAAQVAQAPGQDPSSPYWSRAWRLACTHCGHVAEMRSDGVIVEAGRAQPGQVWMGVPLDPYFHLPLWLQVNCLGKTLWAYNERHLDELDRYVRARVRERTPNVNRSVASRLPPWIKSAKNREQIAHCINALRERL